MMFNPREGSCLPGPMQPNFCLADDTCINKWPTVLVRKVKGKPHNYEAIMCGSLYSTFETSF